MIYQANLSTQPWVEQGRPAAGLLIKSRTVQYPARGSLKMALASLCFVPLTACCPKLEMKTLGFTGAEAPG